MTWLATIVLGLPRFPSGTDPTVSHTHINDIKDIMRNFELIIKLRATEGQRVHKAYISAADESLVIDLINENLKGRFFAIRSHVGGMLTPENSYPVIINTNEVLDIMVIDRGEMEQA